MAVIILGLSGAAFSYGPATAQSVSSAEPGGLAKLLRERGQSAIVTIDEFNDPLIETSVNNIDYQLLFYGCTDHQACTSISLRAQRISPGRASFEAMNAWNADQRWTKVFTPEINSAILEMDVWFGDHAMTRAQFEDMLDIWERSLVQFVRFIDDGDYALIVD